MQAPAWWQVEEGPVHPAELLPDHQRQVHQIEPGQYPEYGAEDRHSGNRCRNNHIVPSLDLEKLLVGMDMRDSSFSLASSLMKGMTDMGCDVEYLDLVTTPMTYFATEMYNADGAIMVTASHNPKEYNGLKFSREHAIPVGKDSGLQDVEELVLT